MGEAAVGSVQRRARRRGPRGRARALAGGVAKLTLPSRVAKAVSDWGWQLWRRGVPAEARAYATHPWAVASDRLKAAGWTPHYSSEEAIVATDARVHWDDLPPGRRQNYNLLIALIAVVGVGAGIGAAVAAIRRRGRRAALAPHNPGSTSRGSPARPGSAGFSAQFWFFGAVSGPPGLVCAPRNRFIAGELHPQLLFGWLTTMTEPCIDRPWWRNVITTARPGWHAVRMWVSVPVEVTAWPLTDVTSLGSRPRWLAGTTRRSTEKDFACHRGASVTAFVTGVERHAVGPEPVGVDQHLVLRVALAPDGDVGHAGDRHQPRPDRPLRQQGQLHLRERLRRHADLEQPARRRQRREDHRRPGRRRQPRRLDREPLLHDLREAIRSVPSLKIRTTDDSPSTDFDRIVFKPDRAVERVLQRDADEALDLLGRQPRRLGLDLDQRRANSGKTSSGAFLAVAHAHDHQDDRQRQHQHPEPERGGDEPVHHGNAVSLGAGLPSAGKPAHSAATPTFWLTADQLIADSQRVSCHFENPKSVAAKEAFSYQPESQLSLRQLRPCLAES